MPSISVRYRRSFYFRLPHRHDVQGDTTNCSQLPNHSTTRRCQRLVMWNNSKDYTSETATTYFRHLGHQPNCHHLTIRVTTTGRQPISRSHAKRRLSARHQQQSLPSQQLPGITSNSDTKNYTTSTTDPSSNTGRSNDIYSVETDFTSVSREQHK